MKPSTKRDIAQLLLKFFTLFANIYSLINNNWINYWVLLICLVIINYITFINHKIDRLIRWNI